MKIFWSWQSDTDGKTGRNFVLGCLKAAVAELRQTDEIYDPPEQEIRSALEVDRDRQGVMGHPGLADTIFDKIASAAVFVADMTLVAEIQTNPTPDNLDGIKKLINSNVAIEYGYAVRALGDKAMLLVMNLHYGPRGKLPFDLSHKVAPCRYTLAPNATRVEINQAAKALTKDFVNALRLHIVRVVAETPVVPFKRLPSFGSAAFFWQPGEVLARYGSEHPFGRSRSEDDDRREYTFSEHNTLYLRLIPATDLGRTFGFTELMSIVSARKVQLMSRGLNIGHTYQNKYGALLYEISGTNLTPPTLTQLHTNGEIWAVASRHWNRNQDIHYIDMKLVEDVLGLCLANSVTVAQDELHIAPPYNVVIGMTGMGGMVLSKPIDRLTGYNYQFSPPVHGEGFPMERVLNDNSPEAQEAIVHDFLKETFALVGIDF
jgi:hypothetical protein